MSTSHDAPAPSTPLRWARPWAAARFFSRPTPRAGGWYRVVGEASNDRVVLQVGARKVAIARKFLEIRDERPDRFSVVVRPIDATSPAAGTSADPGRIYAVCPRCNVRVRLAGKPPAVTCRSCGHRGEVAWWETA